ncbi:MAG TPA: class I SAM-dependent methyltransferase [Candidatus Alectryocaccobium stercorigallinarum]|nr:class I SAM-dependent methyltransferase [Candidatus Alectryocaccobium stercorigallinarum]
MDLNDILKSTSLELKHDKDGLYLTDNIVKLRADLVEMAPRLKKGVLDTELLVRAAKIKKTDHALTAIDATAGFGQDSLLLAAAGFSVKLYEKNPVIAALLEDALNRAKECPELKDAAGRMELAGTDSIEALKALNKAPDVIYLDPMFPKRKKSALIKKKFQLLQQLETPCENEIELFEVALAAQPRKIVVKRPAKGAYLADRRPSYSLAGKAVRYDVFVLNHNYSE